MNLEQIKIICVASRQRRIDCHIYVNLSDTRASVAQAINRMRWRSTITEAYHWAIEDDSFADILNTKDGHTLDDLMAYLALVKHYGSELTGIAIGQSKGSLKDAAKMLENCYLNKFKSEMDFADKTLIYQNLDVSSKYNRMFVDLKALGQHLLAIDYQGFAAKDGGVYVFFRSKDMTRSLPAHLNDEEFNHECM